MLKIILLFVGLVCADARHNHASAKVETENSGYDWKGHKLYQGDMVLTEAQRRFLTSPLETRKAESNEIFHWPSALVPYRIHTSSLEDRAVILKAMQHWEHNTCVQFQEVAKNYASPHLIFKKLDGCYSNVGRDLEYQPRGQVLSIGPGCNSVGTIVHEVGHALGFQHEQARPDRDEYVIVLEDNIIPDQLHNFDIERNINDYEVPYDITSIMHYGIDDFAIDAGKNTLVSKDPLKHFLIRDRQVLSFADIKLANIMYKCGGKCRNSMRCKNSGFVDKNCRCICPHGFFGESCQEGRATPHEDEELSCGGAISQPSTIRSPNYPNTYPAGTKCVWLVTAPAGRKVRAQFKNFEVSERYDKEDNNNCVWDFFEVRRSNLHDGDKYCGSELKRKQITSDSNTMVFVFSTQYDYDVGFEAQITFV